MKTPTFFKRYYIVIIMYAILVSLIFSLNYANVVTPITDEVIQERFRKTQRAGNLLGMIIVIIFFLYMYVFFVFGPSQFLVFNGMMAVVVPYILLFWSLVALNAMTYYG